MSPLPLRELEHAAIVGIRRHVYALEHGVGSYGWGAAELNGREPIMHAILSAAAEDLVALHEGEPWNAYVGDPRREPADVGDSIEVRWCDGLEGRTSLLVRPDDKPERDYYLVHGPTLDELVVVGWLPGRVVMARREWLRNPNGRPPAWFAPAGAVWPALIRRARH